MDYAYGQECTSSRLCWQGTDNSSRRELVESSRGLQGVRRSFVPCPLTTRRRCRRRHEKAPSRQTATARADESSSARSPGRHRRQHEGLRQRDPVLSTPTQRAMGREGIAAARDLLLTGSALRVPTGADPDDGEIGTTADPRELRDEAGSTSMRLERDRRRASCRVHMEHVLRAALRAQRDARVPGSSKATKPERLGGGCEGRRRGRGHQQPERPRHGGADGQSLTADMLSHLGPLPELTELDLCVEGLSSAPLLRACTSLKSLGLNVNRFLSPTDLTASTALVRLGLRRVMHPRGVEMPRSSAFPPPRSAYRRNAHVRRSPGFSLGPQLIGGTASCSSGYGVPHLAPALTCPALSHALNRTGTTACRPSRDSPACPTCGS